MKRKIMLLAAAVALAGVIGILTVVSGNYQVKTITDAISAIGDADYSPETRDLIDQADAAISKTDPNLHLTDRVENLAHLRDAKVRYVEKAIIRLYKSYRDKEPEETIIRYLADAQEAYQHYFTEDDSGLIHNYRDLVEISLRYFRQAVPSAPSESPETTTQEPIELC